MSLPSSEAEFWKSLQAFLDDCKGRWVIGFIGFDPMDRMNHGDAMAERRLHLFVPASIRLFEVRQGEVASKRRAPVQRIRARDFDLPHLQRDYCESVEKALSWIHEGRLQRVTLARRLEIPTALDLAATFASDSCCHPVSRNFYYHSPVHAFAGQSPELLAHGNRRYFHCHKLSGTWRINPDCSVQAQEQSFFRDPRIASEHESSISTIQSTLARLGEIHRDGPKVMRLPSLLHGWSDFACHPHPGATLTDCVRSIFPYGTLPMREGLEFVHLHEAFHRGPYYGIVGVIEPSGSFSFSQILRTAFRQGESFHLLSGAAITQHSTADVELQEAVNKMDCIELSAPPHSASDPSRL
jgi:anthranilate/para-aminobenzoate synthase component I